MSKIYYKNWFVKGSRPDMFCKQYAEKNYILFAGKPLCRSLFFSKVNQVYFHFWFCELFLQKQPLQMIFNVVVRKKLVKVITKHL